MKKMNDGDKVGKWVYGLLFVYKKYFVEIAICLICASVMTFFQPLVIRRITDQGMAAKNMLDIFIFSGVLVGISVVSQIMEVVQARIFSNIHNGLTFSLYQEVYWKMERLKINYYDDKGSAEIANTISCDINNVASVADQVTAFSLSSILQIVGGIVGLSLLDRKLALLIILLIPIKYLVVYNFSKKKNLVMERLIENNKMFFSWFGDCIDGMREMKLWNLFSIKKQEFELLQKKMMDSYKENMMLDEYRTFCVSVLDVLMNALLYMLSGVLIVRGEFTIGGAFAFITYSGYVVSPISFLINIKYYFAQIMPSANRLFEFMEQPEETTGINQISGKLYSAVKKNKSNDINFYIRNNAKDIVNGNRETILELIDVKFGYNKETSILKNVNLTVQRGEKIAIIGENGSGKSTLFDLILGFHRPEKGQIKLWGTPMEEMDLKDIRSRISVVSQKPYLFQGTIEQNLNIEERAIHRDVIDACNKSGAMAFIERMEDGLAQCIGQNGMRLSGGEKQKLAVARAILKKADILLMDEATTGFDKESARALFHIMCSELDEKTIIFTTHRLEELNGVEKVYKLVHGSLELQKK